MDVLFYTANIHGHCFAITISIDLLILAPFQRLTTNEKSLEMQTKKLEKSKYFQTQQQDTVNDKKKGSGNLCTICGRLCGGSRCAFRPTTLNDELSNAEVQMQPKNDTFEIRSWSIHNFKRCWACRCAIDDTDAGSSIEYPILLGNSMKINESAGKKCGIYN